MALEGVRPGPVDRGTFERFRASIDPGWVEAALAATGRATLRKRRLPAEQVCWLVLGMALFRNLSIEEVVRQLDLALPSTQRKQVVPSAVAQARARLGPEPLRWLFEKTASLWAHRSADEWKWKGLRIYGVDGTTVRVPDCDENRRHFGPMDADSGRGLSGYPLARLVTLMALRSHLLVGAELGPFGVGEQSYAEQLWALVPDNSLTIVDRNFFSAAALVPLARDGHNRHWLVRARSTGAWKTVRKLAPNDSLIEMKISGQAHQTDASLERDSAWPARAIQYKRRGFRPQILLTSLTDSTRYSAANVIALYHERWELELGFDEVKTEMLEREESIRSRSVRGVEQELWGLLLAYNLIRLEMQQVAREAKVMPSRISFIASLRLLRTTLLGLAFANPGVIPRRLRELRADIGHFVLPERRTKRRYPRAVKTKMSNYPRKRPAADPRRWPGAN